jgi:hypothetical protein
MRPVTSGLESVAKLALGLIIGALLLSMLLLGLSSGAVEGVVVGVLMCGAGVVVKAERQARWIRRALMGAGALTLMVAVVHFAV